MKDYSYKYVVIAYAFCLLLASVFVYVSKNSVKTPATIKMQPLNANAWLSLIYTLPESDNLDSAMDNYFTLAKNRADILKPLLRYQVRHNHHTKYLSSAKQLISIRIDETWPTFKLLEGVITIQEFVDKVVPESSIDKVNTKADYIGVLVKNASDNEFKKNILGIWKAVEAETKDELLKTNYAIRLYRKLRSTESFKELFKMSIFSNRVLLNDTQHAEVDFAPNTNKDPFCWILNNNDQVKFSKSKIQIGLNSKGVSHQDLLCFVPTFMSGDKTVKLKSRWGHFPLSSDLRASDAKVSLSFRIIGENLPNPNYKVITKKGSWHTEEVQQSFLLNKHSYGIEIKLSIASSHKLVSEASELTVENFQILID